MATKKTDAKSTTTVGRQELSRRIAKDADLSQKQAQAALEATLVAIRETLEGGSEVRLVGFGSFKVRESAARRGVIHATRNQSRYPRKSVCVSFLEKNSQTLSLKRRNSIAPFFGVLVVLTATN